MLHTGHRRSCSQLAQVVSLKNLQVFLIEFPGQRAVVHVLQTLVTNPGDTVAVHLVTGLAKQSVLETDAHLSPAWIR